MKNKIFKTLEHKLQWLVLLAALLGVGQGVYGYDIGANGVKFYFIDTTPWGSVNMYYWGSDWNNNQGYTQISGTKIYYYSFDHTWTNLSGFLFNKAASDWTNKGSDIYDNIKVNAWFDKASTSGATANKDMSKINGTAYLKCKINSNNGSGYVDGSNANCVATVSGKTVSSGATSTSNVSSSTGSGKQSVSISPAYGSTVEYTGTNGTGYTYMGSSSTESTSLPADKQTSKRSVTSNEYNGGSITYYAYFKLNQYSVSAYIGNVSGGSITLDGSSSTLSKTVNHNTSVTFAATPNSGYKFVGWNTAPNGGGTTKSTNASYTVSITEDTILYAIFEVYVAPSNLYIKGPIVGTSNNCWPYNSTPFSKDGNVFTKTITASKYSCSYDSGDAAGEFILSTVYNDDTAGKLNGNVDFAKDGGDAANWDYSTRSDATENFKYNKSFDAGDQLIITVTFITTDGSYKMKIESACTTPGDKSITISSGSVCSGNSVSITVVSPDNGYTYKVYDSDSELAGSGVAGATDLVISITPTESTTYTVKALEKAGCAETPMTDEENVVVIASPTFSPSTNITKFLPVTISGNASSTWTISPTGTTAWLSASSGSSTVFKAPAGSYQVTDTQTNCSTATITVAADPAETCP